MKSTVEQRAITKAMVRREHCSLTHPACFEQDCPADNHFCWRREFAECRFPADANEDYKHLVLRIAGLEQELHGMVPMSKYRDLENKLVMLSESFNQYVKRQDRKYQDATPF
jgi:hypothetical protein